jgi:hypothetical protein
MPDDVPSWGTYKAEPIEDAVKRSIFDKYQRAIEAYRLVQIQELRGTTNQRLKLLRETIDFKTWVLALALELSPKLSKHGSTNGAKAIGETTDILLKAETRSLSLRMAKDYLLKAGAFLEESGITNIEVRKHATEGLSGLSQRKNQL